MSAKKKIKELALAIATMNLHELVEGHRRRLLILDSQIEALRQEREALAEERWKLQDERIQLHALYKINCGVLNLIGPPTAESKGNRDRGHAEREIKGKEVH